MDVLTLKLDKVKKTFYEREILSIDKLMVYMNDRIGIVGKNGEGKSTLLRLISGELKADSGEVHQEVNFNYFAQIDTVDETYRADQLDSELLGRLHIPTNEVDSLSGGELTKYRLAQVLSHYQPGLLLDEPTTHLDRKSIQFLMNELEYYYGTLITVSHDRYFLDQVVNKIWEVDNGQVKEYIGNYSAYKEQKEEELKEQKNAYEKFQKERSRIERSIETKQKQAQKASKTSTKQRNKNIKPDRLAGTKQKDSVQKSLDKSVKAMETRLEQMDEVHLDHSRKEVHFPKTQSLELHNSFPIMGEKLTVKGGDKVLLDKINFQFELRETIAITGDNGTGKSSLLQAILNNEEGITLSPKIKIATYEQLDYQYDEDISLLSYLMKQTEYEESFVRAVLNQLGFEQRQINTSLSQLSGGEATKIALANVFIKPSNTLVLDEPTNFIDVYTIEALETFIKAYPGTVLLTSHDQYFVEKVASRVYKIEEQDLKRVD